MATFGNITAGATSVQYPPANNKAVSLFRCDYPGTLSSIILNFTTTRVAARAVIYASDGAGGSPGTFLGVSSEVTGTTTGLFRYTFSPSVTIPYAGLYYIGLWGGVQGVTNGLQTSPTVSVWFNSNTYASTGNPANPFGGTSTNTIQYPIQAVYTPTLPAPSFLGYTANGDALSTTTIAANTVAVYPITNSSASKILTLTLFLNNNYAGAHIRAVLYDNTGTAGAPGSLIATSNEIVGPVVNANQFVFPTTPTISTNFYIGIITDTTVTVPFATGSTSYSISQTYGSGPPSSFGTGSTNTNVPTIWVNLPSATTLVQVTQTAAEIIRSTMNPPMNVTQLAAEVIRSRSNPPLGVIQLAAEVLRSSLTAATSMWESGLARETLYLPPDFGRMYSNASAREALLIPSTGYRISYFDLLSREALVSSTFITLLLELGIAREALVQPTTSYMSASIREALINPATPAPTQGWFDDLAREALIVPSTVEWFSAVVRESLLYSISHMIEIGAARESLILPPPDTNQMSTANLAMEVLLPPTMLMVAGLAFEKLRDGRTIAVWTGAARETLLAQPPPLPPTKHRKAYVWININRASHT